MLQLIEKHSTSAKSTEDVNEKKKSFPRYTKTFSLLPHKNNFTINYVPLNKSNLVSINESRKLYCPNVKYNIEGNKTVWPEDVF